MADHFSVLLFSVLAERLERRELKVDVHLPVSAGALLKHLSEHHPHIRELRSVIRVAVNHEYADEATIVRQGDEVALITPTSGG